jgi:hypothetical protein
VIETPEKSWPSNPARASASSFKTILLPASSAKMASKPVPAEGSSTTSAGAIAAALAATKARSIGVENCCSARLSWDRRVWVGRSRDLAQHLQLASGRRGLRADGWTELAEEQDGRSLAGVVRRLPVPRAGRIGAAEGALHGGSQRKRVDAVAAFKMWQKKTCSVGQGTGHVGFRACQGEQRLLRGSWNGNDRHGEDSESGNGPNRRALSRPHRFKPVPAALFLSFATVSAAADGSEVPAKPEEQAARHLRCNDVGPSVSYRTKARHTCRAFE